MTIGDTNLNLNTPMPDAIRQALVPTGPGGTPLPDLAQANTLVEALFPDSPVSFEALGVAMTPGALLLMLRRRLSDLDSQIDNAMTEIDSNTTRSEFLQKQVEAAQLIKASMASAQTDPNQKVELGDVKVEWEGRTVSADQLLNDLGMGDFPASGDAPTEETLTQEIADLEAVSAGVAGGPGRVGPMRLGEDYLQSSLDSKRRQLEVVQRGGTVIGDSQEVTGTALDAYIQQLSSRARRTNSSNEMLMVQMQSAMQQRGQAVSMATQMLKALNEQMSSIVQNVGR